LQPVRADFSEQMGRSPILEQIDELLSGINTAALPGDDSFLDEPPGPVREATEALDGDGPLPSPANLEKALALTLQMLRLFVEHNGEQAEAAFLNESLGLVESLWADLPVDAQAAAVEHTASWDERGWPSS
jgi:hypothetical protein